MPLVIIEGFDYCCVRTCAHTVPILQAEGIQAKKKRAANDEEVPHVDCQSRKKAKEATNNKEVPPVDCKPQKKAKKVIEETGPVVPSESD